MEQKTEGERIGDFLIHCFYNIKSQNFAMLGLHVTQVQNGAYKIEFILDNAQEERINQNAEEIRA